MDEPHPFEDTDLPADPTGGADLDDDDIFGGSVGVDDATGVDDSDPFGAPADAGPANDNLLPDLGGAADDEQKQDDLLGGGGAPLDLGSSGPNKLQEWEQQREQQIQERIQKAKDSKQGALDDAKDEIAKFYAKREEQLERTKSGNLLDEENTKKDLSSLMEHGTVWQKVARQCNLQPRGNEERKVGRMRKLLVQLKNEKSDDDQKEDQ